MGMRMRKLDRVNLQGYIEWELEDADGRASHREGKSNTILNYMRTALVDAFVTPD